MRRQGFKGLHQLSHIPAGLRPCARCGSLLIRSVMKMNLGDENGSCAAHTLVQAKESVADYTTRIGC